MRKDTVKRPGHPGQVERVDEQCRRFDLSFRLGTKETPQLLLPGPRSPLGLILEGAKRDEVTEGLDDLFHGGGTKAADQLVLQVGDAHEEADALHLGTRQVGAEPGPLEPAPEIAFLPCVTQARQSEVEAARTVPIEEACDVGGAPHRHDGNRLSSEISAAAPGERLERELIADAFNEDDRSRAGCFSDWCVRA
jgi:hypothetical protein